MSRRYRVRLRLPPPEVAAVLSRERLWGVVEGDCRSVLRRVRSASVDSVVTDPPYGLNFMGKDWDHGVPGELFWREVLRVAKPGAHLLAFGGTRTHHRLACAIEDAGWMIRNTVMWVYGSGFPKSLDVSKAIDELAGVEREVVGSRVLTGTARIRGGQGGASSGRAEELYSEREVRESIPVTAPTTPAALDWQGWGTDLKPAWEPIIVARKPLAGTVAENVLRYGTGAINVDGCRVGTDCTVTLVAAERFNGSHYANGKTYRPEPQTYTNPPGRWPANLIHDGSEEVVGLMPADAPGNANRMVKQHSGSALGGGLVGGTTARFDSGTAARFFYSAKASKADRDEDNHHPTVKPTDLMRYLCRLVTPPDGVVLDPFTGSGSTGKAALLEGFRFIGIELEPEYADIARRRIRRVRSRFWGPLMDRE